MVIITFLLKYLTKTRLSAVDSCEAVIRFLIGQSNKRGTMSFVNRLNKSLALSHTTLLVIWLLVSLVLNKSYTSLLLNTYFNVKTAPVVQSLEDIRHNKNLLIAGMHQYLSIINDRFLIYIEDILTRLNENHDNYPYPITSSKVAEKVLNGKSVFIGHSEQSDKFFAKNNNYYDKLVVANKFLSEYVAFYVVKQLPMSQSIHF